MKYEDAARLGAHIAEINDSDWQQNEAAGKRGVEEQSERHSTIKDERSRGNVAQKF